MAKTKKQEKNVSIEEVYSGIEIEGEATKPISFRADKELCRRIATLEQIRKQQKPTIIKEAIDQTFTRMVFESIHRVLFEVNKEVFPEIKVEQIIHMVYAGDAEDEKDPFALREPEVSRCAVIYKLPYGAYKSTDADFCCFLDSLKLELFTESESSVKIRASIESVTEGKVGGPNPLFSEISQMAAKEGFQTETRTNKVIISQNIFFERMASIDSSKWKDKYKKEISSMKKLVEEINSLMIKNKALKKIEKGSSVSKRIIL